LGARSGDVTGLVVRDVAALVAAGMAIGGALSRTGVTLIGSPVARIAGVNHWAVVSAGLVIVVCGVAAAYGPARRAVRTDPMAAIRYQ
jgi:ABC-type antimicrobial peptide transport system permease subunit